MEAGRCVVLGLDGVSHELLTDLVKKGIMPACGHLLNQGALMRMNATLPEISSVSWTSFMTGKDAGCHGIYGFVDLVPMSYRLFFPNSGNIKSPSIFEYLARDGKRSVVINLPGTYPVQGNFPGVLVCGFVAADLNRAVYPDSLLSYLKKIGYQVDVDASNGRHKSEAFLSDLSYSLAVRKQLLHKIWQEEKWDLFMFVVTETDRLQHFYFDAIGAPGHPLHEPVMDFFRQLDELIAELSDLVSQKKSCPLFMLSDHGFYPLKREINLNPILRSGGYGAAKMDDGFSGIRVGKEARAFALDPSRIFIHERGRYPDGQVEKGRGDGLKQELKAFFLDLKVEGEPVIRQVFSREEVYHGPETQQAADLLLLSHPGYDLKGGLSREDICGQGAFSGMHGHDNAFFYCSDARHIEGLADNTGFSVEQAAAPVLKAMGVHCDG